MLATLLNNLKVQERQNRCVFFLSLQFYFYFLVGNGIFDALGTHITPGSLILVHEKSHSVCTTVAIAIVAETCGPFTVLPAVMNEYRVPELNVQNGVLKSLSFLFEYIGEMGKVKKKKQAWVLFVIVVVLFVVLFVVCLLALASASHTFIR